ncbi:MAG: hypothetical protein M1269_11680 [Chloroflexi bacterium]|nr:hypothetical protein [Chloroflexota bacterium]
MKSIYKSLLLFLAVLLFLGFILSCTNEKENTGEKTEDLPAYKLPEVAPVDNAAALLIEAAELYVPPDEQQEAILKQFYEKRAWKKSYSPLIGWIQKNKPALDKLNEALKKPGCIFPLKDAGLSKEKNNLDKLYDISEIICITALKETAEGDYKKAIEDCDHLLKLAELIKTGGYDYWNDAIGFSIAGLGKNCLFSILYSKDAPYKSIINVAKEHEYNLLSVRDLTLKSYMQGKLFFDLFTGSNLKLENKFLDQIIKSSEEQRRAVFSPMRKAYEEVLEDNFKQLYRLAEEKKWAEIYAEIYDENTNNEKTGLNTIFEFITNTPGALVKIPKQLYAFDLIGNEHLRADLRGLMIAAAGNAYMKKFGKPPESPAALVPEFLDNLPADPFDGKSFRYKVRDEGKYYIPIVYSVGADKVDGGGKVDIETLSDFKGHDLIYRMNKLPKKTGGKNLERFSCLQIIEYLNFRLETG